MASEQNVDQIRSCDLNHMVDLPGSHALTCFLGV